MENIICAAIDIGTTTISAVVVDITEGVQLEAFNRANTATTVTNDIFTKQQSPDIICDIAKEMLDSIIDKYPSISSIGVTGQMHGMLYIDEKGNALSSLYTWQDARGSLISSTGISYVDEMKRITGHKLSSGFGLVTHYYNMKNGLVPKGTYSFCSIMDYFIMRIASLSAPILHPSVAASFGLFDIENNDFDKAALEILGIDIKMPAVCSTDKIIGEYRGITVIPAIGDNQASVFGSVRDEDSSILVNYGTGSQVSVICNDTKVAAPLEVRPYIGGKYLVCGCALCGGYSYSLLENFFSGYAKALGIDDNQYKVMDLLAQKAYTEGKVPLEVLPFFKGTRDNEALRGSINGIDTENFTAECLILGVIKGMAAELYDMYRLCNCSRRSLLVASGNGVQKNKVLQSVLCDMFEMELCLPSAHEEAAMGAAIYSAYCTHRIPIQKLKECIMYK